VTFSKTEIYSKLNAILSVFLCVLAVIMICGFLVLMVVRSMGVGHVIRNTSIVGMIEETTVGINPASIVDQINELPFNEAVLNLYDVEDFLRLEAVSDELAGIVDAYATAFMLGNHDYHITKEDVITIARNLEPEINEFFSHRLTEEDFDFLAVILDDIIEFETLSIDVIMEDFDVDLTIPLVIISPVLIWVAGILSLVLLAGIFLRKFLRSGKNPVDASLAVGIPIAISGFLALIFGLVAGANPTILGNTSLQFVRLVERPIDLITQYGLLVTVVGLIIIVAVILIKKLKRKTD